jgi:hydroxyacylglutathione hydrolase
MTIPRSAPTVLAVPAFSDNYLWLIHDGVDAAVVDPGDGAAILAALAAHRLNLTAILLTHHHPDHIGGVPELLRHAAVPVYGPRADGIEAVTIALGQGERITVPGLALDFSVLDVPGHTAGHIAYVGGPGPEPWLFCGDTLFAAGCGRLFEGTPAQMAASLAQLAALPGATRVYCAHEYTLNNLRFALAVEPGNADLQARMDTASALRAHGQPTIPSTIAVERATNPFLRAGVPEVRATLVDSGRLAADADDVAAFAALRNWKDNF